MFCDLSGLIVTNCPENNCYIAKKSRIYHEKETAFSAGKKRFFLRRFVVPLVIAKMWPERFAVIAFFALITSALVAENLERTPPERHSWFAVLSPVFVLQAVFAAILLASFVSLARIFAAWAGPAQGSKAPGAYTPLRDVQDNATERRRHADNAPDLVWGSIFLGLFVAFTVLLACKLNAVDAALGQGTAYALAGGPSWGAVFGVLLAGQILLFVFWLVSALHACMGKVTRGSEFSSSPVPGQKQESASHGDVFYGPPGSPLACAGSLGRCRCAQGFSHDLDGERFDAVDITQEIALYLTLVAFLVSTVLLLARAESTTGTDPALPLVFTPLFVAFSLLLLNAIFFLLRTKKRAEYCYDWAAAVLYTAGIILLVIFFALVAAAASTADADGDADWHGAFAPLYVFLSLALLVFCSSVVYFASANIRKHEPGQKAKWGPLVRDEFAVSKGGTKGISDDGTDDAAFAAAATPGSVVDQDDAEFDDI